MLFLTRFAYTPQVRDSVIARFKETGGQPPPGVQMRGRWHLAAGGGGFHLMETSDASLIVKWTLQWSDLMTIDTFPVVDDQEVAKLV